MSRTRSFTKFGRSRQRALGPSALLLVWGAFAGVAGAQTITSIGSLGPTSRSEAFALSSDGSAVVGYAATPSGILYAVRWTSADGLRNLGVLPGGIRSLGFGVSADGEVVTGMGVVPGAGHVFRWTPSGGMQDLGTLAVQNVSYGFAVSSDGMVIAGGPSSGAEGHALTWSGAAGLVDRGVLPGDTSSAISALSVDGQAGAGYSGGAGGSVAVRWTASNGMEGLGTLPGGADSEGTAISADGSVVAGWSESVAGQRAFRWAAGAMQDLGVVPGRSTSTATAMSSDGSVVAGYDEAGAIIWTPALGMVDLPSYLASRGVNLAGWTLRACYAISGDGTALAGTGQFNGPTRGWVVRGLPSLCAPVIVTQPADAVACPTGSASFEIDVSAGPNLAFQWQIQTAPDTWMSLGHDPLPLPCGGWAFLMTPFVADARISIRPCPGVAVYHVRCVVSNACGSVASTPATYTVCRADFNCDGAATSQDFFDFLTAFFTGDADFNADGRTDSQDFFDFLTAFFAGC